MIKARENALIVEDQEYNRVVLADMVRELGFEVETAADAAEAFGKFARGSFSLVLIDSELSGLKGPDIARRLRDAAGGRVTIIGTSAHDDPTMARKSREAGMDAVVTKPITIAALRATIEGNRGKAGSGTPTDVESDAFNRYARGVSGGLAEAVDGYLAVLREELSLLRTAFESGRREEAAAAAHRLGSHAAMIGAGRLHAAANALESAVREDGCASAQELLPEAMDAAEVLEGALTNRFLPPVQAGG